MSDITYPPDPLDVPDPDIAEAQRLLNNASKSTVLRLTNDGEIASYVMGGRRFWRLDSIRSYKARCINRGPQWGEARPKGKRGRPRKRTTVSASAAE